MVLTTSFFAWEVLSKLLPNVAISMMSSRQALTREIDGTSLGRPVIRILPNQLHIRDMEAYDQ